MAMDMGRTCVYQCHVGLFDFAAPIVVDGKLYGIIVGGQVMPNTPSKENTYRMAEKLGIEPEVYWQAAQESSRAAAVPRASNLLPSLFLSVYVIP